MSGEGNPDFAPGTAASGWPNPSEFEWSYTDAPLVFSSALTATSQTYATLAGLWTLKATWTSWEKKDLVPIMAYLNSRGLTLPFTTYMFDQPTTQQIDISPSTALLDTLVVDGDDQSGFSLNVTQSSGSDSTQILEAGDIIGFTSTATNALGYPQLFQVVSDASLAGGDATISLGQSIKEPPKSGDQIFTRYVPIKVRITQPVRMRTAAWGLYSMEVAFVEHRP